MMPSSETIYLSVVIPCFNEEDCIAASHARLTAVCQKEAGDRYELVFVNDGSTDQTFVLLSQLAIADQHVVIIDLSRNHGHQLALSAGLSFCRGQRIFIIDADLQDPPELLPAFMKALDGGADVAYGQRESRRAETVFKKFSAKVFYRVLDRQTEITIPLDTGDFRLMTRQVLNVVLAMPESHRFIRGMVAWAGFRQTAIAYERQERFAGTTKYPLQKMFGLALDALTSFGTIPLRFLYFISLSFVAISGALVIWSVTHYLWFSVVPGWASLMVVYLTISSVQLLSLAFIGEYVGRIFEQSKHRPLFIVRSVTRGGNISTSTSPQPPTAHL